MATIKAKRGETLRLVAPADATELRIAGVGKSLDAISVTDGEAVVPPSVTETMGAGNYMTEWMVVRSDGTVRLPSGPRITMSESIAHDKLTHVPQSQYQAILQAAKDTLASAAESGDISFSSGDSSFSFESRRELLAFVNRLETIVARELRRRRPTRVWRL